MIHIAPVRFYDTYLRVTCAPFHNTYIIRISQQLINFISTMPLALEIIIPIEFNEVLASFVYFCIVYIYIYDLQTKYFLEQNVITHGILY